MGRDYGQASNGGGLLPAARSASRTAGPGRASPGPASNPSPQGSRVYQAGNRPAGSGTGMNSSALHPSHPGEGAQPRKSLGAAGTADAAGGGGNHLPAIASGHSRAPFHALAGASAAHHSGGAGESSVSGGGAAVTLPSISHASVSGAAAASAAAAGTHGPVVVSFVQPKAPGGSKLAARAAANRAARRSSAAAGGDAEPAPAVELPPEDKGFLRGLRRIFGMDSTAAAAAAAAARAVKAAEAAKAAEALRQAEALPVVLPSPESLALLTSKHEQEQERMKRFRLNLPGPSTGPRTSEEGNSGGALPTPVESGTPRAMSAEGGERSEDQAPQRITFEPPMLPERNTRGKSFTQKALQDPHNPIFKSAMQLALAQEKEKTFVPDKNWRERLKDDAPMERPILMDEGWKI